MYHPVKENPDIKGIRGTEGKCIRENSWKSDCSLCCKICRQPIRIWRFQSDQGADCSGFVMRVYEHFGYHLRSQFCRAGGRRSGSGGKFHTAGDLLFYRSGGRISHVTMYIGNGKVVHASNSAPYPKGGIKISSVSYRTPCRAVRIIK